tara:strand:- start:15757 stop:16266 length:510 start_codon:yes stop_codon:yes gene_type:complete
MTNEYAMIKRKMMGVSVTLVLALAAPVEASIETGPDDCAEQQVLSTDEQTVCSRFHEMVAAAQRVETDAVFGFFQPDGFSAALSGRLYSDWSAWAQEYRESVAAIASFDRMKFPEVRVRTIAPDTILLLNTYDEQVTLQDGSVHQLTGFGTQVWTRQTGDWRIVHIAGQ